MKDNRGTLLNQLAMSIVQSAQAGWMDGKPISIIGQPQVICGPRAGAVQFVAGFDAGRLLSALQAKDCALLRQFIPWPFPGEPSVYLQSRFVRVEAPWPDSYAERDIRLTDLASSPRDGRRWIVGKNELGATVTVGLSNETPHYLIAGWTGSGKTEAIRSALVQLSRDPANAIVLVDGKYGAGLKPLEHLPGVVGPCAVTVEDARNALAWSVSEMRQRYIQDRSAILSRVVIAVDEIQEFTGKNGDDTIIDLMSKLIRQGREVGVHCLIGTQHPTLEALSDSSIKRNLPGRIALRVENAKASEVAIGGSTPRADWLCGCGDSYVVTPQAVHRVQVAHLPLAEIESRYNTNQPRFEEWMRVEGESLGTPEDAPVKVHDSGLDLALALIAAKRGSKRRALGTMFEQVGLAKPGSDRLDRLVAFGQEQLTALDKLKEEQGWTLCE